MPPPPGKGWRVPGEVTGHLEHEARVGHLDPSTQAGWAQSQAEEHLSRGWEGAWGEREAFSSYKERGTHSADGDNGTGKAWRGEGGMDSGTDMALLWGMLGERREGWGCGWMGPTPSTRPAVRGLSGLCSI